MMMNDGRLRIIDTNIVREWMNRPHLIRHYLLKYPSEQRAITIITAVEMLFGWINDARKAGDSKTALRYYPEVHKTLKFLKTVNILPFDEAAVAKFDDIPKELKRSKKRDAFIAAIALSVDGIVVTRNTSDFEPLNVDIENWLAL